jgi:NAD+ diphosphatase
MSGASDSPPTPPSPPFAGATIDRAAALRHDPAQVATLLAGSPVAAIACDSHNVLVEADGTRLARTGWHGDPDQAVLLGIEAGRALVGVDIEPATEAAHSSSLGAGEPAEPASIGGANGQPGVRRMSLREAGTVLSSPESGLAAYLVALMGWHRKHRFCSVCGSSTVIREAGFSRRCPDCGASHFPRTDPVVIMTVECDDRLLLGSRNGWDPQRYSVLAGFISPGETPEEAVLREVHEESGVRARDAVYVGSQPWPFPASLMLGFHAEADGGEPEPGGDDELSDVRWFPRAEVIAMQHPESPLQLPPEVSIARLLIDRWVDRAAA